MVTSKRKVSQDTAVDYESNAAPVRERSRVTFNDDLMMMRSYVENSATAVTKPEEPVYKQKEAAQPEYYETPAVSKSVVKSAEIMPVITKKQTVTAAKEEVQEKAHKTQGRTLTPSMKKALIAYLSIVIVLTITIIVTGVAINNASAAIVNSESRVSELTQTIALQSAELESLSDPEFLGNAAAALGMTNVTASITTPLVGVREIATTSNTNWFDAFCDWIGSIFGG